VLGVLSRICSGAEQWWDCNDLGAVVTESHWSGMESPVSH